MQDIRIIQSIQRAIDIINCFSQNEPSLSIPEIASRLELNVNTVRGIIQTLTINDILVHDKASNTYSLSFFFNAKSAILSTQTAGLLPIVKPYIFEIAQKFNTSASFQLVQADTIRTIHHENSATAFYQIWGHDYLPLPYHASSSGKLFFALMHSKWDEAFLSRIPLTKYTPKTIDNIEDLKKEAAAIRKRGYSIENGEIEISFYSIAIPLLDSFGNIFASISVSGTNALASKKKEIVESLESIRDSIENEIKI